MRPLRATRPDAPRRDPAPSRLGYRINRWMLTPGIRRFLKVGLPILVVGGIAAGWYAQDGNRQMIADAIDRAKMDFQSREEFMVKVMAVDGASDQLDADIRTILPLDFPVSSWDLDLEDMQDKVAALPAVAEAAMRVRPGGVLQITVQQREPVAVFRAADGLRLIDAEGVLIAPLGQRADRPDLPLITGDGAREALAEGLRLYDLAGPLTPRMRAVVRMGERRWDVILEGGQRILLPTQQPVLAFEQVVALHQARDLFDRDIAVVDMRNQSRPTIRLNENAVTAFRQISADIEEGNEQ